METIDKDSLMHILGYVTYQRSLHRVCKRWNTTLSNIIQTLRERSGLSFISFRDLGEWIPYYNCYPLENRYNRQNPYYELLHMAARDLHTHDLHAVGDANWYRNGKYPIDHTAAALKDYTVSAVQRLCKEHPVFFDTTAKSQKERDCTTKRFSNICGKSVSFAVIVPANIRNMGFLCTCGDTCNRNSVLGRIIEKFIIVSVSAIFTHDFDPIIVPEYDPECAYSLEVRERLRIRAALFAAKSVCCDFVRYNMSTGVIDVLA